MWPLMMYDVTQSAADAMERTASRYIRKWLGVPPSFSNVGLYGKTTVLVLPLSAITEEYHVTKVRAAIILHDSEDAIINKSDIKFYTGRKWTTNKAIQEAESRLKYKAIVGTVCKGRQGLGYHKDKQKNVSEKTLRREKKLNEVRHADEESRQIKAVAMDHQGAWTNWTSVLSRDLKWKELIRMEPVRIKFLIAAVYDMLPSPSNLLTWGKDIDPYCLQCGRWCNLQHILSSCRVSLADGMYTWRHNQVLEVIARVLEEAIKTAKKTTKKVNLIRFVKAGEQPRKISEDEATSIGILPTADDWKIVADLYQQAVFPHHIAVTALRPDVVLFSNSTKQVIIAELTVPWETRIEESHERKMNKYDELKQMCQLQGWKCLVFPIEVGCRGFPATSVSSFARMIGLKPALKKTLMRDLAAAAEKSSCWIWLKYQQLLLQHLQMNPPPGRA